jgi:hypothetical protein
VDGPVGAHRQARAQRFLGPLRTEGHRHDLVARLIPLLLDPEAFLQRELVVGGDDPGDPGLVDRAAVAPDFDLGRGVRDLFHEDEHLHASGSFERCDSGDPGSGW